MPTEYRLPEADKKPSYRREFPEVPTVGHGEKGAQDYGLSKRQALSDKEVVTTY